MSGVEFGRQCFCGTRSQYSRAQLEPDTACNKSCPAESSQKCGGPDRLTIYDKDLLGEFHIGPTYGKGSKVYTHYNCIYGAVHCVSSSGCRRNYLCHIRLS